MEPSSVAHVLLPSCILSSTFRCLGLSSYITFVADSYPHKLPLIMCNKWRSVLPILATMAFAVGLATPVAPHWGDVRVKHAWDTTPADWESLGPPPAGTSIDLHIALEPRNENALIDAVYEVSTPGHPKKVLSNAPQCTMYLHILPIGCRYGAHLSKEEVAKLITPHPDTLELVYSWLSHHGLPSSSISFIRGGSWLKLTDVSVSHANQLLGASYEIYRDVGANGSTILRTVGYGLPAVLHAHIRTVLPTTCFASIDTPSVGAAATPDLKVGPRNPAPVVSKEDEITPTRLRWLYNTFYYVPKATDQNVLAIAGFNGNYPSPAELMKFMWEFRQTTDVDYTVERVNGGRYDPWHPSAEGNTGMQYTQAIAYPTPLIYYSIAGTVLYNSVTKQPSSRDDFYVWLTYLLDQTKIPQTISSAIGTSEEKLPLEYVTTLCKLFLELAGRGVSVLFSSGNFGVGYGDCKDDSGNVYFRPMFPASCTNGILSPLSTARKYRHKSLTTLPRFCRSLGHWRRRNDGPSSRSRGTLLHGWILNPFSAP